MRVVSRACIVLAVSAIFSPGVLSARGAEPVNIRRGEAQLFVDDFLIDGHEGLKRTLRHPTKYDGGNVPVLALDKEFGDAAATLEANGSIVYDPRIRKWVMFALAFCSQFPGPS